MRLLFFEDARFADSAGAYDAIAATASGSIRGG